MTAAAPDGWHSVTPRLFVRDVEHMVAFLRDTFGATGDFQVSRPCEMRIGDSIVMVSGIDFRDATSACLYVYVHDVDATYRRALAACASVLEEPQVVPYGDRRCMLRDPWDNVWQIATRKELL